MSALFNLNDRNRESRKSRLGRERSLNSAIGDAVDIVCLHLKAMAHERFPLKWKRCHHFQLVQIPQIEIAPSGADDVLKQTLRFRQCFYR